MKITQKIINKIEGEATLKIHGNERVDFVEIEFWQYRGIENYLVGRDYMDALVINPRICGICGHSHLLATAKAIEKALNINITKKASILRDITVGLEIIQNHIKWFYITLFPTRIKDNSLIFKALNYTKEISKAIALISGQYPHNSYIIPGGVTCDLTGVEVLKVKNMLKKIEGFIEEIISKDGSSKDLEKFFETLPKDIGKSVNRFLVLGENLYFWKNGRIDKVKEEKNSSLSKNVFYEDTFYEVGPLARNIDNKLVKENYQKYGDSIYTRIFARLYEMHLIIEFLIKSLDEFDINEPNFLPYKQKNGYAKIAIEAPRGSLIHEVEIENEVIRKYNIIVPTQFNLSSHTKENPSPAQKALIDEKVEYIDPIFKCFDICAVCVSH